MLESMSSLSSLWKPVLEIIILWFVVYNILVFFAGTRAVQVLNGIIILIIIFVAVRFLKLEVLEWLMIKIFAPTIIGIFIVFQPEIRRGLARLGQRHLFSIIVHERELAEVLNEIVDAVYNLSEKKIGALIAIERQAGLKTYIESGTSLEARVLSELIQTIFTPTSPLHDGGIIIRDNDIVGAVCLFPLTERSDLSINFGTRHRAAIGLSEETDALVIVVSEETKVVSLAVNGKLTRDLTRDDLFRLLKRLLRRQRVKENEHI